MTTPAPQAAAHYIIRQRFTPMINRYEIWSSDPAWNQVAIMGFAEQKRMKLREEITFFTNDSKTERLFSMKARNIMDFKSLMDVFDAQGQPIGHYRKDFAASLLRSTWFVGQPGLPEARGQESNLALAIIRRVVDTTFLPYDFDFLAPDGSPVLEIVRKWGLRDTYRLTVFSGAYDLRVLHALAVGLDTLQNR